MESGKSAGKAARKASAREYRKKAYERRDPIQDRWAQIVFHYVKHDDPISMDYYTKQKAWFEQKAKDEGTSADTQIMALNAYYAKHFDKLDGRGMPPRRPNRRKQKKEQRSREKSGEAEERTSTPPRSPARTEQRVLSDEEYESILENLKKSDRGVVTQYIIDNEPLPSYIMDDFEEVYKDYKLTKKEARALIRYQESFKNPEPKPKMSKRKREFKQLLDDTYGGNMRLRSSLLKAMNEADLVKGQMDKMMGFF